MATKKTSNTHTQNYEMTYFISKRRRSESDELQMRQLLAEGDLISAEIQAFFQDGAASLHTRSLKYGKLRTGTQITVPSSLIKRSKSHFLHLHLAKHIYVNIILGMNGYVWVSKGHDGDSVASVSSDSLQRQQEVADTMYLNLNEEVSKEERLVMARVCNCIQAIAEQGEYINEQLILGVYETSLSTPCAEIFTNAKQIVTLAKMSQQQQ